MVTGKKRKVHIILAVGAVIGTQLLSGCSNSGTQANASENSAVKPVVAMAATLEHHVTGLEYKGYIMPKEEKKLSFGLSGKVKTVYVEKGQRINAGEIIAEMDTDSILASIDSAAQNIRTVENSITQIHESGGKIDSNIESGRIALESLRLALETDEINLQKLMDSYNAKISTAQMNYDKAKDMYDKTKLLYDAGALSLQDLQNAEFSFGTARTELESLQKSIENDIALQQSSIQNTQNKIKQQEISIQALQKDRSAIGTQIESANIKLRQAEIGVAQSSLQLDETVLTSPIDGYISDILVKSGENTSFSSPVVKIQSLESVIHIGVPVEDYRLLKTGMTVNMEAMDTQFSGYISSIALSPDESSRTYAVEIIPDNHELAIGTLVEVYIPLESSEDIFIPLNAIITSGGISYVYSLEENGGDTYLVRRTEIEGGDNPAGDKVLVTNILPGTLIVSEGVKNIKENDIVTIVE